MDTLHSSPSFSGSLPLSLSAGAVRTLRRPHDGPMRLLVSHGRVWLTRSGDPDDHFLGAGDDLLLCGTGDIVVECDSSDAARLCLIDLAPAAAQRGTASKASAPDVLPPRQPARKSSILRHIASRLRQWRMVWPSFSINR
jgi:hypothetical protein